MILRRLGPFAVRRAGVNKVRLKSKSFRQTESDLRIATQSMEYTRIELDFSLSTPGSVLDSKLSPTQPQELSSHTPEEEIALGPACWLWDYLRRSRQAGFFLPLS